MRRHSLPRLHLECKRALISQMVTERKRHGSSLKLCFIDVKKAYFHGRPTRNLFVRLPKEMGLPRSILGKLKRCLYGTRDAGHIWEAVYGEALIKMGFTQGVASPCCFHHRDWEVSLVVHGDDFTALGTEASLQKFECGMQDAFEVKLKGKLGPEKGDKKRCGCSIASCVSQTGELPMRRTPAMLRYWCALWDWKTAGWSRPPE